MFEFRAFYAHIESRVLQESLCEVEMLGNWMFVNSLSGCGLTGLFRPTLPPKSGLPAS